MKNIGIELELLDSSFVKKSMQITTLREIYRADFRSKDKSKWMLRAVRIHVHHDGSYPTHGYGKCEVWLQGQWNEIHYVPGADLRIQEEFPERKAFQPAVDRLMKTTAQILTI